MKTIFSREKNPYGQKPEQQKRIKNIFKVMKNQDDSEKMKKVQKRFDNFINSKKSKSTLSPEKKVQQSMKNINRQLDKLEREIL